MKNKRQINFTKLLDHSRIERRPRRGPAGLCSFFEDGPVPRFFIDVHADSLSNWDDAGQVLQGADEAIALASELALDALLSSPHIGIKRHAAAVIRDEAATSIATVTVGGPGEPQILWETATPVRISN